MKQRDPKLKRLAELGVLNVHPERVRASWFRSGDFFDARDLVQAKYEMLRHVRVAGVAGFQRLQRLRVLLAEHRSTVDKLYNARSERIPANRHSADYSIFVFNGLILAFESPCLDGALLRPTIVPRSVAKTVTARGAPNQIEIGTYGGFDDEVAMRTSRRGRLACCGVRRQRAGCPNVLQLVS